MTQQQITQTLFDLSAIAGFFASLPREYQPQPWSKAGRAFVRIMNMTFEEKFKPKD